MRKTLIIIAGIAVVILVGLLLWHPWSGSYMAMVGNNNGATTTTPGGSVAASYTVTPSIPQVPTSGGNYSVKLTPGSLTIKSAKGSTTVLTSAEITTVHHDALAAAIRQMQSAPSSSEGSSPSFDGTAPVSIADYLQELAQTMGLQPLSTSYTVLYGKEKVYFAAKGTPNSNSQGKISVFSYDTTSGLTQVAVLPDVGLEQVSDVALSPDERYLVLFQCNPAPNAGGCYQLSYGFFVFDLTTQKEVGFIAGAIVPSPDNLYSFGQWSDGTDFSYHIYQPTTTTGGDVVQLGNTAYALSGDQTYNIQ